ncbi:MAG: HAD-IB family hydrolase [Elusimicrobia bacterium]|nr:HAD-IB family hydrolase [Elusimicrobiota bacterium]
MTAGRAYALFDFDGTITSCDTFNDFLAWRFGTSKFLLAIFFCLPLVILYKLGIVSNDVPKGFLWKWFMKDISCQAYLSDCHTYSLNRIPRFIRHEALAAIRRHVKRGDALLIVSASPADWIRPWAQREGFLDVIATEVEVHDGSLTGQFATRCCHGNEKVARLRLAFPKIEDTIIYGYGDGHGDKPMLRLATYRYYKTFSSPFCQPDSENGRGRVSVR